MKRPILILFAAVVCLTSPAQLREHPAGKVIPHEKFIRVVPESESPVERLYIPTRDGLYVAAALRKPKGAGPFPALIYFHGAPGGRGMEKLVSWSLGTTGGPLWERFLQEGYVTVVADYRNHFTPADGLAPKDRATYADDGVAVFESIAKLPYVDPARIAVYGVSRGGAMALFLASRVKPRAVVLGAGAATPYLVDFNANAKTFTAPLLILVGDADSQIHNNRALFALMSSAGKSVQMEIFAGGYHDFVAGPQGHAGRDEPLLTSTLEALDITLDFLKRHLR
jgi:dipeptidyl aminopeptidase/acylaminoacyl peptidase